MPGLTEGIILLRYSMRTLMDLHKHVHTHIYSNFPMVPWYIPACSKVVMDTPRHIRHPISGGMLSASEGLAPNPQPPFSTPSPKMNSVPILPENRLSLKKKKRLSACQTWRPGRKRELFIYLFIAVSWPPLLLTGMDHYVPFTMMK